MSEYIPRPKQTADERTARLKRQADEAAEAVREYVASETKKIANMARLRAQRLRSN